MNKIDFLPKLSAYFDVKPSLEQVLIWAEGSEWKDATVKNLKEDDGIKFLKSFRDSSITGLKKHRDEINALISEFVEEYASRNNLEGLELEQLSFVRYTVGQFFAEHSDGGPNLPRRLSMVLYLNDNYSGGEIYFTKFKSVFKPVAGTLFLFPSTEEYSHAAQPVVDGTKYVMVGFWK